MARKLRFVAAILACLVLFRPAFLNAQYTNGNIGGTVSDPSGAMIPGAEVTITNEATGAKRVVTTNAAGFFTAPSLPVGTYTVSATAKGFKTAENRGLDLHVREDKLVPVVLQIGQVTETVEVTGGATLVELTSGEVSSLIGAQQVSELPLNGRSFVQLTLLVPGASAQEGLRPDQTGLLAGVDISMSGSPANTNAWLVDGVDNVDHGSGRTILVYPSVDSIDEFKVERNAYGPEMPAAGGAQINLVTKGGSNAFHGTVYEYLRNDKLNAANFFLNRGNAQKGKLRFNDYGYTIGGPIKKDKAFFFFSQEWRRQLRGVTRKATVPTALERQGIFTGPLSGKLALPKDPFTGKAFPGNQMPTCAASSNLSAAGGGCLSPAGLATMRLFPLPTNSATIDNWAAAPVTSLPTRQEQVRTDWHITQNHTFMFRYTQESWKNPAPNFATEGGLWGDTGFPTVDSSWDQPSKNMAFRLTSTLGPSKVNEFQFSYSNNRIFIAKSLGNDIIDDMNSKIPDFFPSPANRNHAIFWGLPFAVPSGGLWNNAPWDNAHDIYVWKDDFSKIAGNHTVKVGGLFSHDTKDEDCCGSNQTLPQFWGPQAVPGKAGVGGGWGPAAAPGNGGNVTGNFFGDLLLKGAYWGGSEQSSQPRSKVRWKDIEFYSSDTWRTTPRLTLNYGLRWSIIPPSIQADNFLGNFLPSLYDPRLGSDPRNGMVYPVGTSLPGGQQGVAFWGARALRSSGYNTVAPRLGVAWDPTGQGKWSIRAGYGWFYGRADLSQPIGELIVNPPFNATVNFGSGRPLDFLPSALPTAGVGTANNAADINWKIQGSYQWNFTVERELMRDTKLELSYVGNGGRHLPINYNLNRVPRSLWAEYARRAFDSTNPLNGQQHNLRLLFPLKGSSSLSYLTNGGNSSYHAFQLFLTKRFSNNYSFQVAYTWSKLLATSSLDCCQDGQGNRLTDPENPNYNRGPASFDRTQILTMNAIYNLPKLADKNAVTRYVLGGWEGTGIYQYATGVPLTPHLGQDIVGVGSNNNITPDLLGATAGRQNGDNWYNPLAFALPNTIGRLGTTGVGIMRGPPTNNADLAIYKNFPLRKIGRMEGMSFQFRLETFNTFNHTQFLGVDNNYTAAGIRLNPKTGVLGCGDDINNLSRNCSGNAQFGSPTRAREPRELQMALKFIF